MGFMDALRRRPPANLANPANRDPPTASDSQDSQDSQRSRAVGAVSARPADSQNSQDSQPCGIPRAQAEAELARVARAGGLDWRRLREHPDGMRDVDIEYFAEHWYSDCGAPLARPTMESIAYRLGIDRQPIVVKSGSPEPVAPTLAQCDAPLPTAPAPGERPTLAYIETLMRTAAAAVGVSWARLREHPDGVRDADLQWFRDNWDRCNGVPDFRCMIRSRADRLRIPRG